MLYEQPKKQCKVQIIGILDEIDSFHWPKMHFLKRCQKIWAGPPPLIRAMPQRVHFFVRKPSLSQSASLVTRANNDRTWSDKNKRIIFFHCQVIMKNEYMRTTTNICKLNIKLQMLSMVTICYRQMFECL